MKINYSNEPVFKSDKPSVFLAGPTYRDPTKKSWREEAIKLLQWHKFDGVVYVPEQVFSDPDFDYNKQIHWEWEALTESDCIAFWVPRSLPELPGFTTNVEFGYWMGKNPKKVLYGRPEYSEKNRYLDELFAALTNKEISTDLKDLMWQVVKNYGN